MGVLLLFLFSFWRIVGGVVAPERDENRNDAINYLKQGKMNGYLAYLDHSPVGWCNVDQKGNFERLSINDKIRFPDDHFVGSIVCFLIEPGSRKKGVAGRLLERICEDFKRERYQYLEAYPRVSVRSDAENYHGPLSMYLKEGFSIFKEFEDYLVVRKKLHR